MTFGLHTRRLYHYHWSGRWCYREVLFANYLVNKTKRRITQLSMLGWCICAFPNEHQVMKKKADRGCLVSPFCSLLGDLIFHKTFMQMKFKDNVIVMRKLISREKIFSNRRDIQYFIYIRQDKRDSRVLHQLAFSST